MSKEVILKYRDCEITITTRADGSIFYMAEIPPRPYGEKFYISGELVVMPEGDDLEALKKEIYKETWRQYNYEYSVD